MSWKVESVYTQIVGFGLFVVCAPVEPWMLGYDIDKATLTAVFGIGWSREARRAIKFATQSSSWLHEQFRDVRNCFAESVSSSSMPLKATLSRNSLSRKGDRPAAVIHDLG